MKKIFLALAVVAISIPLTVQMWKKGDAAEPAKTPAVAAIQPVPLPDPKIQGFKFPEDEQTVLGWTKANKQKEINLHGWGIWAALTSPVQGRDQRVFETWLTPDNIISARFMGVADVTKLERALPTPTVPRQFHHGKLRAALPSVPDVSVNQPLDIVQYDPIAAGHIKDKKLLQKATLKTLLEANQTDVPAFPAASISVKPTYVTAARSALIEDRYFRLEAWPGPPETPGPFGPEKWKQWVWIDTKERGVGTGTGAVDKIGTQQSRKPEATYGLARFIYHKLSATEAQADNAVRTAAFGEHTGVAVAGDFRLLVGMHVTSREITRWTWQTFWWTPAPDSPPAPSSQAIAGDRPTELKDAPRNYAMSIGYDMLTAATPNTGGDSKGEPLFVYNPWLEAGFGSNVLSDSKPWTFNGKTYDNKFGIQTNCMSCHAQAHFGTSAQEPEYTADRYIDLNGPAFNKLLKVDFLWSLPDKAK
jgi:hypothetical protein